MKRKVLFLCTGNSARSQMAEAIVNARLGNEWEAVSAGTQPTGYVHPLAVRALAEMHIAHAGRSKSADEFRGVPFDLVVTDYNMPGMSGLDLARTLREICPDLPVILISGRINDELQRQAPAAGVRELIFKADAVENVCEAVARYANAQSAEDSSS